MNNEIHTCDWFLDFFGSIPEDRWCVGDFSDGVGRFCALGHSGESRYYTDGNARHLTTRMGRALSALFNTHGIKVGRINDGRDEYYQQNHPKLRILAALRNIKAKQEAAAEAFELRPLNLTKPQPKELCEQTQN